jgi:hypothetical protein
MAEIYKLVNGEAAGLLMGGSIAVLRPLLKLFGDFKAFASSGKTGSSGRKWGSGTTSGGMSSGNSRGKQARISKIYSSGRDVDEEEEDDDDEIELTQQAASPNSIGIAVRKDVYQIWENHSSEQSEWRRFAWED